MKERTNLINYYKRKSEKGAVVIENNPYSTI